MLGFGRCYIACPSALHRSLLVGVKVLVGKRQHNTFLVHGKKVLDICLNFKAEIELRMLGSVVEIEVMDKEDGVYFHRFFCCLKPSIDGSLNGCRPFLSIDSTALNGRWYGHLPLATTLDAHN